MRSAFLVLLALTLPLSASAKDAGHAHAAPPRMTGWEAFSLLQTGNMNFYEGKLSHPRQNPSIREGLATGQKPHTILVSCSDSRLPPETVFDQGLGDIFVVRIAGNVVTPEAIASIEYAVAHLGSKLLLVMGHESCGAVGAAIASRPGVSNGSPSLDQLVSQIRGHLSSPAVAAAETDKTFRLAVKENVSATLRELLQRSEIVRNAVGKEGLLVGQAIYSLKSGRVEFWEVGAKTSGDSIENGPAIVEQQVKEELVTDKPAKKAKAHAH